MGGPNANVNGLTAVHQGSGGMSMATPPDVCLTPGPSGPPVPVPYPNIAMSADLVAGTTTVKVNDQSTAIQGSMFAKSTGDEAGVGGGVASGTCMQYASWLSFSPTVTMDGNPVCRLADKMLMNTSNTVCGAGEVQAPLPPPLPLQMPEPEKPKVCTFQHLVVECSHCSKRAYKLDAERDPGSFLQVITSATPEKLKVAFEGNCTVHPVAPGCAKIHVLGPDGKNLKVAADHSFEVPLSPRWDYFARDWYRALLVLVGSKNLEGDQYTVYGTTCEGSQGDAYNSGEFAIIEVFPNVSWEGEVEFGYEHEKAKRVDGKKPKPTFVQNATTGAYSAHQDPLHMLESQGTWKLKGSIKAKCGRSDLSVEFGTEGDGANKDSDPMSRKLFQIAQRSLNMLAGMLNSIEDFYSTKLDVRWPSLKLGGSLELVELEGKANIAREGKFFLSAEPLIGAEVKIDILDWLIRAAGALGGPAGAAFAEYLVKIKRRLAEGKLPGKQPGANAKDKVLPLGGKIEFGIIFSIGGDVGGALGWKCDVTGVHVDGEKAKIEAGVDLKLEAMIKVEAKVWIVKSSAGVSISMLAADGKSAARIAGQVKPKPSDKKSSKPEAGNYFGLVGVIDFNGLAVYYAYYADLAVEGKEADGEDTEGASTDSLTAKPQFHHQFAKESTELCTLLKPWSWPDPSKGSVVEAV